jgi:hypothetical protein
MTSPSLLRNCGNPSERVEKWGIALSRSAFLRGNLF